MSDAIPVRDVTDPPVPMLRSFEWVSRAFESWRERPLPGAYGTVVQPVFDVFAASRIADMAFESAAGGVGNVEAYFDPVPDNRWRHYTSVAFQHDDGASTHVLQAARVLATPGTFPFAPLGDPKNSGAAANGIWYTERNIGVPPGGRVGAMVEAIGAGAQIFLRGTYIELDIGEPFQSIS